MSRTIRATAWAVVALGTAAPLLRRRLRAPAPVVLSVAACAPFGLAVAMRRSRARDVGVCLLQMWAYVAAYKMPHDDPDALERRVHVDYPIAVDRVLGLGTLPTVRLQRSLPRDAPLRPAEQVLVWTHWLWFLVPHSAVAYVLARRRDQFTRSAVQTYAVFDLGAAVYWAVPTAPPWYAAQKGRMGDSEALPRRMMVEHGERFWRERWGALYSLFGGNPLAAMPSVHFATSVMAASVLAEAGTVEGTIGWTYALVLGFALVYLGEHYVVDLLAGLGLALGVRRAAGPLTPAFERVGSAVAALEARAHGAT
jgi:membrane-associated phospholipid phosphatase